MQGDTLLLALGSRRLQILDVASVPPALLVAAQQQSPTTKFEGQAAQGVALRECGVGIVAHFPSLTLATPPKGVAELMKSPAWAPPKILAMLEAAVAGNSPTRAAPVRH